MTASVLSEESVVTRATKCCRRCSCSVGRWYVVVWMGIIGTKCVPGWCTIRRKLPWLNQGSIFIYPWINPRNKLSNGRLSLHSPSFLIIETVNLSTTEIRLVWRFEQLEYHFHRSIRYSHCRVEGEFIWGIETPILAKVHTSVVFGAILRSWNMFCAFLYLDFRFRVTMW